MRWTLVSLAALAYAFAAQIPAGTPLQIRLTSKISSANARVNDPFSAVVIAPVVDQAGHIVLGASVKITGHVAAVKQPKDANDNATLDLSFDEIATATAKAPLAAKLTAIDNARETINSNGEIVGIVAADTGSARLDQGINKLSQRYEGLGQLLGTFKQAVVKDVDASITYDPGVEMTIELTKPLDWTASPAAPAISAIEPADRLAALVASEPFRTKASNGRDSDIANFMFIGTADQLRHAFETAGWSTADKLSHQSEFETFRALTEMRGYKEAPVSTLYLAGAAPDLVFQKQNNTFAARHHLRIWRRAETFDGKPVWIGAGTHDTGIDFSQQNYTFIHKIDPQLDRERAKVVNDLLYTGAVKGLALVDRPQVPKSGATNATGDELTTDGRIAVVEF